MNSNTIAFGLPTSTVLEQHLSYSILLEKIHKSEKSNPEEQADLYQDLMAVLPNLLITASTPGQQNGVIKALHFLNHHTATSQTNKAKLWENLGVSGRAALFAAATSAGPQALVAISHDLLFQLIINTRDKADEIWVSLGHTRCAALMTTALTIEEAELAIPTLLLLNHLIGLSSARGNELWAALGETGQQKLVTAATALSSPKIALLTLSLLAKFTTTPHVRNEIWLTFGETGRANLVNTAVTSELPKIAKYSLTLLNLLNDKSTATRDALWTTLMLDEGAAILIAATNLDQPEEANEALKLLATLTFDSPAKTETLWAQLREADILALINAAATQTRPDITLNTLFLLGNLAQTSEVEKNILWVSMGSTERAAIASIATANGQSSIKISAINLLTSLCIGSDDRTTAIWAILGEEGCTSLVASATTPEAKNVTKAALVLISKLQNQPLISMAIWPLLQPRLTQLWVAAQDPSLAENANALLFTQTNGNIAKIKQVLNALNAAVPVISVRNTIATFWAWALSANRREQDINALLSGIVQANSSPQRMGQIITAVVSGTTIGGVQPEQRQAIRERLLNLSATRPTLAIQYQQHVALGFDLGCCNSAAVLENQEITTLEKLNLLEIFYIYPGFLTQKETETQLASVLFTPNISPDLMLGAIGLIFNHGQLGEPQFRAVCSCLVGKFEKEKYSIFSDLETDLTFASPAGQALAKQRQQYLALYQNFQPHMTPEFIKNEITQINQQVKESSMPRQLGQVITGQLQQFYEAVVTHEEVYAKGIDSKLERKI
ncbi:hypothetical protein [Polaromonas vacuolata]|uniref:hypothetical protein n=1 Tax=Polaromonas vacuolata TaxID=37448 RepID=UPI00145788BE|nr:hypothetical protein [Polaromonas vacuolata]